MLTLESAASSARTHIFCQPRARSNLLQVKGYLNGFVHAKMIRTQLLHHAICSLVGEGRVLRDPSSHRTGPTGTNKVSHARPSPSDKHAGYHPARDVLTHALRASTFRSGLGQHPGAGTRFTAEHPGAQQATAAPTAPPASHRAAGAEAAKTPAATSSSATVRPAPPASPLSTMPPTGPAAAPYSFTVNQLVASLPVSLTLQVGRQFENGGDLNPATIQPRSGISLDWIY